MGSPGVWGRRAPRGGFVGGSPGWFMGGLGGMEAVSNGIQKRYVTAFNAVTNGIQRRYTDLGRDITFDGSGRFGARPALHLKSALALCVRLPLALGTIIDRRRLATRLGLGHVEMPAGRTVPGVAVADHQTGLLQPLIGAPNGPLVVAGRLRHVGRTGVRVAALLVGALGAGHEDEPRGGVRFAGRRAQHGRFVERPVHGLDTHPSHTSSVANGTVLLLAHRGRTHGIISARAPFRLTNGMGLSPGIWRWSAISRAPNPPSSRRLLITARRLPSVE